MSAFRGSDILEIAVRIEENGENFYRYATQLAKDEEAKKIFGNLAEAEKQHQKTFGRIFAAMEKENPPETYSGEYDAYLHDFVDNKIIFKKELIEAELAKVKDTLAAIDFAIQRELDSILFYHEIKKLVPTREHGVIDDVIDEERKHFKGLSALRARFAK